MQEKSSWLDIWGSLILLSLVWGSSFILIKKSLGVFSATEVAMLRISISSIAFAPLLWIIRKKVDWNRAWFYFLIGLTGSGIPSFFFAFAQTQVSSSVAGILNSLTPIFTLLVGIIFFGTAFKWNKFFGVFIGFLGALILTLFGSGWETSAKPFYIFFIVAASLCYGLNVNLVKTYFQKIEPIVISCVSFCLIGPPAISYLIFSDVPDKLLNQSNAFQGLGYICILSLFGTVMSTIIFYRLVQKTTPVFASSVAYLIPVVALFWGMFDGEYIGIYHLLGMIGILLGVYLIRRADKA